MSEEVTYYSDRTIEVTSARAVFGEKTYALANITSVTMEERPTSRIPGIVIAIVGVGVAACTGSLNKSSSGIVIGILVMIAGIVIAALANPRYVVRLGSASGESDAFVSKNRGHVQRVVNAVNEAIIRRG